MNLRRFLLIAVFALLPAGVASAQVRGTRFEITAVGDSTVSFAVGNATWVHQGITGITVDPRRRDALVAQFRIIRINNGIATGVITGQTTRLATEHVAILEEPKKPWYKTLGFWGGAAVGFMIGAIVGSL